MRLSTLFRSVLLLVTLAFPVAAQDTAHSHLDDTAAGAGSLLEPSSDSNSDYYSVATENVVLDSFGGGCDCGKGNCKDGGKGGKCDDAAMAKRVAGAHKGVFYANDFSYLNDACYDDWHLGDNLKRINVGDCWVVDVGGQYRIRYHSERNINNVPGGVVTNSLGLTGDDDDFLLHRTRLYLNAEYGSHFRVYGEMLDAVSNNGNGAPRPIEENRTELQNLFAEVKGIDFAGGTIGARIGRQEVLLGAQRLVSPLDWANTRRTFDGARVMWQGDNWDVDGIWLRPMKRDAAHRTTLDAPNLDQQLYGMYATYKGLCRDNLELYWLALDYEDIGPSGFRYDTLGGRYWGSNGDWLYEFEGGVQFGENADATDHSAGFVTAGLGRKFSNAKFKPTVWMWYDWASGDDTVGNGFHHYEPLAHKYNGFMDIFGRRNLQDVNLQAIANLTDKTQLLLWYHYFSLANGNDVPYNVTMTPFAGLAAGSSGSQDLGHEIDVLITQTLSPRSKVLLGYSHFFAGDYYATTVGVPINADADFFYAQWHVNF
jgi:hypothetical protein